MMDYVKITEDLRRKVKEMGLEQPHQKSGLYNDARMRKRIDCMCDYLVAQGCSRAQAEEETPKVLEHNAKRLRAAWRGDLDNVKEYVDQYLLDHDLPKGDGDGGDPVPGPVPEPIPEPVPVPTPTPDPVPIPIPVPIPPEDEYMDPINLLELLKQKEEPIPEPDPVPEPEEGDEDAPVDPDYIPPKIWRYMCSIVRYNMAFPKKRVNVILVGPKGIGKTEMIMQLAKKFFPDKDVYALTAPQQEWKIVGYNDAMGREILTPYLRGYIEGGIILIDEIDAAMPEPLISINMSLANRCMDTPTRGLVHQNDLSMVFATANTSGTGATNEYNTRNKLDASTRDRFVFILMEWEHDIAMRIAGGDENLVAGIEDWNDACDSLGFLEYTASYRAIKVFQDMLAIGAKIGRTYDDVMREVILKFAMNKTDLGQILDRMGNKRVKFYQSLKRIQEAMPDNEAGY